MAISQNDYTQLTESLNLVKPFIHLPSLNLEEQALFIENIRKITLILVEAVRNFSSYKEETKRINKALLGYVLSIPRLEEQLEDNMFQNILYQIECINVTAIDLQNYMKKNYEGLCLYIEENK